MLQYYKANEITGKEHKKNIDFEEFGRIWFVSTFCFLVWRPVTLRSWLLNLESNETNLWNVRAHNYNVDDSVSLNSVREVQIEPTTPPLRCLDPTLHFTIDFTSEIDFYWLFYEP